jgi:RNA polymerase sigma-70 factor, ECF subfamily
LAADATTSAAEFDQIVDQYYRALFSFGHSLTGNEHAAADLVQQTFYRWAGKGNQLRDRTKVKTWLFTTLHREFLQGVRRDQRLVALDTQDELPDERRGAATEAVEALDAETVTGALAEIEETFRVPLSLFYLQEFAYAEIAELLDIPVGTVMSRLSRGKDRLRQRLLARRASAANLIPLPVRKEIRRG